MIIVSTEHKNKPMRIWFHKKGRRLTVKAHYFVGPHDLPEPGPQQLTDFFVAACTRSATSAAPAKIPVISPWGLTTRVMGSVDARSTFMDAR
jgi:hypothetical protein